MQALQAPWASNIYRVPSPHMSANSQSSPWTDNSTLHTPLSGWYITSTASAGFFDYWALRMARRASRDLVGHTLDSLCKLLPQSVQDGVSNWATPIYQYFLDNTVTYKDITKKLISGQPVGPWKAFKGTIIAGNLDSIFKYLSLGKFFSAFTRVGLMTFSGVSAIRRGREVYKETHNWKKAAKATVFELSRWLIGGEIGSVLFGFGTKMSGTSCRLAGFFAATLGGALFDIGWKRVAANTLSREQITTASRAMRPNNLQV